jgi:SAM-dependent methyltransferase
MAGTISSKPQTRWQGSVEKYDVPHLRLRQVAELVNRLKPKRMLDLGCATGHLRKLCPGVEYTGCDFVVPEGQPEFQFFECDFNHQPLPDALHDLELVVCSGLLEYIEELGPFFTQIRDRLAPGGHFVLTYFNMNHVGRIWELLKGMSFAVHPDWRGFHSPPTVAYVLEQSGFEVVARYAMNHTLGGARAVDDCVDSRLTLPKARPWSRLLAHQLLYVARRP